MQCIYYYYITVVHRKYQRRVAINKKRNEEYKRGNSWVSIMIIEEYRIVLYCIVTC